MNLHTNPTLFKQAVRSAADYFGIPEVYIEKDYWVIIALHALFHSTVKDTIVFKGGTALSKCTGLIERFSEDIDLVLIDETGLTGGQRKKMLKAVTNTVAEIMAEVTEEGITKKVGLNRKTAHEYQKVIPGELGQVRDKVIVEATWLGHYEPHTVASIHSFLYEMMMTAGQEEIIAQYQLHPFEVRVLSLERTLCEKIMSLVRFSYDEDPIQALRMKIRHTYDLHKLLSHQALLQFFESTEFDAMLNRVGNDDVESYKNDNDWLYHHPKEAVVFSQVENVWPQIEETYAVDFRRLVYGQLPDPEFIYATLQQIRDRLQSIDWILQSNSTS